MSPESLSVLVADDEPLARQFACRLLAAIPDVRSIHECADGDSLAALIPALRPHVLLLDVRMPGADVFTTLNHLVDADRPMPAVIFATAFDAYAVRAFEVNAVDYLVKPFTADRLHAAFERLTVRRDARLPQPDLAGVARDMGPRPSRILVPERGRMVAVALEEVLWIGAEDDYARVHTRERSYLVSRSLGELAKRLDPAVFRRIHRSAIVRMNAITSVESQGSSRYRVTVGDKVVLTVSRSHAGVLRDWLV